MRNTDTTLVDPSWAKCTPQEICPLGTAVPEYCPPGKYTKVVGTVMTCEICPANRLCPHYGVMDVDVTTSTDTTYICPDGYVCMGGAIHESLNNDVNVRLCAVGWFCNLSVSGVPESPCPINYYNKSKG